jgi:hypothetical protein
MLETYLTDHKWTEVAQPTPAAEASADRRALLYLLSFLLAGFEQIRFSQVADRTPPVEWIDRWEDDDYIYLEARIPGDESGLRLDLNVDDGVILARIAQRWDSDENCDPLEEPQRRGPALGPAA